MFRVKTYFFSGQQIGSWGPFSTRAQAELLLIALGYGHVQGCESDKIASAVIVEEKEEDNG